MSSVFFLLNDLCVNLSVSTSVCFSYFLFIQLFISNEQLYWLLPPSPLTEHHINHTERAPPSGVTLSDTQSSHRFHVLMYIRTNDTEAVQHQHYFNLPLEGNCAYKFTEVP